MLETYARIWEAEEIAKEEGLNPNQRLAYHQHHSLPAMQAIREWSINKIKEEGFEEHSALGKATHYFLKHYDKVTARALRFFLKVFNTGQKKQQLSASGISSFPLCKRGSASLCFERRLFNIFCSQANEEIS